MATLEVEDAPTPRFWQHTFTYEGKVYIRGGRTADFDEARQQLEATLECFDPIHKTWQKIKTEGTPHPGLTQCACVCVDGILYIYGSCERKVLSQLDLKTMVWSRIWEGPEKDDGKTPMSKAAGGMVYLKGGYLGLFGGYARPSGPLQPGSKWTPNPYEPVKGWTNEFHLFSINERKWLTPMIKGQRPPPCSDFALSGISGSRAVLFGGYQHNGSQEELYVVDFDPIKLEVTFTLKEKTKPWPEGRECHTSCCIGLDTEHPQMLVSGGKNMRDIALKFDMWMLDLKTLLWKKVKLPPGTKRSPRYGHSMTTVITYPGRGLESVIVIGGSPAEFSAKWTTPAFPKLMEMLTYNFGNHGNKWILLEEEKFEKVTSPILELTEYNLDDPLSMKSLFSLEKAHDIPLLSRLTEKYRDFQLEIKEDQPDIISAISKWLRSSKKRAPTWRNLVSVLQNIDLCNLAEKVELFVMNSADRNIDHLTAATHHLGDDLLSLCDSMLDKGDVLRQKIHTFVTYSEHTIEMMKWRYEKETRRLRDELNAKDLELLSYYDDDMVETDGIGGKTANGKGDSFAKGETSAKGDTSTKEENGSKKDVVVKSEHVKVEEGATFNPSKIQLEQKVRELEQQLEHSESTIKLLKKRSQPLKSECQPSESVSVKTEPADVEMESSLISDTLSTSISSIPPCKHEEQPIEYLKPSSSGENFYLQGVDVCGETSFVVTNSAQVYVWKDYGLRISTQDNSLPRGCNQCTVRVKASLSGQYQFPEDCQLVSAVFWLRCEPMMCEFVKPVTLEMQHCAILDDSIKSDLCCVKASSRQGTCPYVFNKIGGRCTWDKDLGSLGSVDMKGFCGNAVCVPGTVRRSYCARIYHFNKNELSNTSYGIDFVMIWNTEAKITTIKKEYEQKNAELGFDRAIEFEDGADSISVDMPMKGDVTEDGWKIRPLGIPTVEKRSIDIYEEGTVIPKCQFTAKFIQRDREIVPFEHQASLSGAKRPNNIIVFDIDPPAVLSGSRKRDRPASESDAFPSAKRSMREAHKSRSFDNATIIEENGHTSNTINLDVPNRQNLLAFKWMNKDGKIEKFRTISEISHKWREIGDLLQISSSQLESWRMDKRDARDCCIAVLHHWLDHPVSRPVTWDNLYDLLDDCELRQVAIALKEALDKAVRV